jgi:hypothetical protein
VLIEIAELGAERSCYCVYSGKVWDRKDLSVEHVIPRSLGGTSAATILCSKSINSKIGTEIDAKIANDPLMMFGRRDARARGNSRTDPIPMFKKARAWSVGQTWGMGDQRFNISIPGNNKAAEIYDIKSGVKLPFSTLATTGFVTEFKIDNDARSKFVSKSALGLGWKVFGERFLATGVTAILRHVIGTSSEDTSSEMKLYYMDPFLMDRAHPARDAFSELEKRVVKKIKPRF